jgi:hypothetical protein
MTRRALPEYYPNWPEAVMTSQAPLAQLPAPIVAVVDDRTEGGARTLHLRISSPRGARALAFYIDPPSSVRGGTVAGKQIDMRDITQAAEQGQLWGFYYLAVPKEGIDVILTIDLASPIKVRVIDEANGMPQLPGVSYRPRPDSMMGRPFETGVSDLTLVTKTFSFEARP